MTHDMTQQLRIRQLVENWAVWRDAGLWDKFRTVWHDDGVMMATWFQGPFEEFIKVTIEGWNKGLLDAALKHNATSCALSNFPTATEHIKSFIGIPAWAKAIEAAFIPAVLVPASACII